VRHEISSLQQRRLNKDVYQVQELRKAEQQRLSILHRLSHGEQSPPHREGDQGSAANPRSVEDLCPGSRDLTSNRIEDYKFKEKGEPG